MIGSIISAILWFALGVIATVLFGLFLLSFADDEFIGRETEDKQKTEREIIDTARSIFGDNSKKM